MYCISLRLIQYGWPYGPPKVRQRKMEAYCISLSAVSLASLCLSLLINDFIICSSSNNLIIIVLHFNTSISKNLWHKIRYSLSRHTSIIQKTSVFTIKFTLNFFLPLLSLVLLPVLLSTLVLKLPCRLLINPLLLKRTVFPMKRNPQLLIGGIDGVG